MSETTTNKPAAEVRAASIIGTIWTNEGEKGTFHTVSFARLYKQDDQWKRSASFGKGDLETLAKVVALAQEKISDLCAADGQTDKD